MTSTNQITVPVVDGGKLTIAAQDALEVAKALQIDSPATFALAGEELIAVKTTIQQLTARREEITKPLTAAHKSVMALFKPPLDYWEQTKDVYATRMVAYQTEQDRLRRQEQARLAEIARQEREKLEEAARQKMKAAQKAKDAEAVLEAQAQWEIAATHTAPVVQEEKIVSAGNSMRETWKAQLSDKKAFIKYIAAECDQHPDLLDYVEANTTVLNAAARLQKSNLRVAGVTVTKETGITSRTSK